MPTTSFFISYNQADKHWAEWIAWHLETAGYTTVLQAWDFRPASNFVLEMQRATEEAERTVVVLSPDYLDARFTQPEWAAAFAADPTGQKGKLLPVRVQECEPKGLLPQIVWIDLVGKTQEEAREALLAGVRRERAKPSKAPGFPGGVQTKGPKPAFPPSYRCLAPAREPFVQRREYEEAVQALLAERPEGRAATDGPTTALQGAGGFGKTALAAELCYDSRVRERFPDGILWAQMRDGMGTEDRLKEIRDLLRWWMNEEPPAFETAAKAGSYLLEQLQGKRVLLVVDDVWQPQDAIPFQGLAAPAALLITTRDRKVLPAETDPIKVDAMEVPEAVQLLGKGVPGDGQERFRSLAARLGEWPLLLKIVNRQLRELVREGGILLEEALREVEEALEVEGVTVFDREDLEFRNQAVGRTVGVSLRRLEPEDAARFEHLAIFPEDMDIPLSVLGNLWESGPFQVKRLCGQLHDLSLLLRFDRYSGTIRIHDVIRAYLTRHGAELLSEVHRRFLDAFRPETGRWSDLPFDSEYLWRNLAHHLCGAGEKGCLRSLLLDFDFLSAKLAATDISALLADYAFLDDTEISLFRDGLRLSAHILSKDPRQIREQLWGRMRDRREKGIRRLLDESAERGQFPWLRPRFATLSRPGGSLLRTIDHPGWPQVLAALSDDRLVSGATDGKLRVWNLETGEILQTLEGHSGRIFGVATLDTKRIVSGSDDQTLRVWDLDTGQAIKVLEGRAGRVRAFRLLDGHRLVTGSGDGKVRIWDMDTGQVLQVMEGHASWVNDLDVVGGDLVVAGSDDHTLMVWEVGSGRLLHTFKGHSGAVLAVLVLDKQRIVSGSADKTLRVWDLVSGKPLRVLEGHSAWVNDIELLQEGLIVSGSGDGFLKLWSIEGGRAVQTLEGHYGRVRALAVVDRCRVASVSGNSILVWDLSAEGPRVSGHSDWVRTVAALDSKRTVSGSTDKTLRVWDVETGESIRVMEGHDEQVRALVALPNDRIASGSADRTVRVWDANSGKELEILVGHTGWINALTVIGSGQVVSASADSKLRLWNVDTGQSVRIYKGHSQWVRSVATLDAGRFISGSADRNLRVWDARSGKTIRLLQGHSRSITAISVLDGGRVVTGSSDQTLRVWDVETGEMFMVIGGRLGRILSLAAFGGNRVVSGSDDKTLRLWDVEDQELLCTFILDAPVTAVTVLPDTRVIVAGDRSGRVHFFDLVEA
jgi:WD40 repeat protein